MRINNKQENTLQMSAATADSSTQTTEQGTDQHREGLGNNEKSNTGRCREEDTEHNEFQNLLKRSCCQPGLGGHLLVTSPGKLISLSHICQLGWNLDLSLKKIKD